MTPSADFGLHPRSHLPWRIVSDVLRMSALELRNPLLFHILMKAENPPRHRGPIGNHSLHCST